MPDFLLELLSEEIPARMQVKAQGDLARLFGEQLAAAGLSAQGLETYATPRRLVLIARDLPAETEAVREEVKGPRTSAPPQALEGFLRKTGLTQDQLEERDGIFFAVTEKPGRTTASVLAEAIPAIVRAFPWPKSMRWGPASIATDSLRWVRPLQGIVALLGEQIVEFEIAGIRSGAATVGHRFHHPGTITIGSANDYAEKLRACHVIVDPAERQRLIRDRAEALAAEAGLALVPDEGLVAENAGLTEWPVPLLGSFDPSFLDVPPEVIQLTMRTNQKYFALQVPPRASLGEGDHAKHGGGVGGAAGLSPNFICTANIEAADGGDAIVQGNRKVLAARLADAKFFWEQDLKTPLEKQAEKLSQIVFHEKLGTVADKVERVAKLARWLVEEGIIKPSPLQGRGLGEGESEPTSTSDDSAPQHPLSPTLSPEGEREKLADMAERAAHLCKADLVTGMVGEFPELQGVIGGYLARAQGEDPQVADAIRDHYKPVGQGDEVPTAPVTVAVSLADKLDSFVSFFAVGERPTGSKDPFALRRSASGLLSTILDNGLRLHLRDAILRARLELLNTLIHRFALIEIAPDEDDDVQVFGELHSDQLYKTINEIGAFDELPPATEYIQCEGISVGAYTTKELFEKAVLRARVANLEGTVSGCMNFVYDRLEDRQRRSGARVDFIRSVVPKEFVTVDLSSIVFGDPPRRRGPGVQTFRRTNWDSSDDVVAVLCRIDALRSFIETPEGTDLLAGYKRAANILKKEGWTAAARAMAGPEEQGIPQTGEEDPLVMVDDPQLADAVAAFEGRHPSNSLSYTPLPEEAALIAALDSAEPLARKAVAREDFEGAMAALATLRAPVDSFFDKVTVNDPDPAKREARLDLLARMRDAVHAVADFSKIEG